MAYMSQEKKKEIAVELKKVMPRGWKYSLGVRHYSTIVLTISQAPVDLVAEYEAKCNQRDRDRNLSPSQTQKTTHCQVNPYWANEYFEGKRAEQMKAIINVLNNGNHDRSDIQSDHFDIGWYVSINFGRYDRPFKVA